MYAQKSKASASAGPKEEAIKYHVVEWLVSVSPIRGDNCPCFTASETVGPQSYNQKETNSGGNHCVWKKTQASDGHCTDWFHDFNVPEQSREHRHAAVDFRHKEL